MEKFALGADRLAFGLLLGLGRLWLVVKGGVYVPVCQDGGRPPLNQIGLVDWLSEVESMRFHAVCGCRPVLFLMLKHS